MLVALGRRASFYTQGAAGMVQGGKAACSPQARWLGCFLGLRSAEAACDVSPSPWGGLLIFAP